MEETERQSGTGRKETRETVMDSDPDREMHIVIDMADREHITQNTDPAFFFDARAN